MLHQLGLVQENAITEVARVRQRRLLFRSPDRHFQLLLLRRLLLLQRLLGKLIALDHVTGQDVFGEEALLAEEAVKVGLLSAFVRIELKTSFEGIFAFQTNRERVFFGAERLRQDLSVAIRVVGVVDVLLQGRLHLEVDAAFRAFEPSLYFREDFLGLFHVFWFRVEYGSEVLCDGEIGGLK